MSVCTSTLKDFNSFTEDAVSVEADVDFGQVAFLPNTGIKKGQRCVRVDVSEWRAVIVAWASKLLKVFDRIFQDFYRN